MESGHWPRMFIMAPWRIGSHVDYPQDSLECTYFNMGHFYPVLSNFKTWDDSMQLVKFDCDFAWEADWKIRVVAKKFGEYLAPVVTMATGNPDGKNIGVLPTQAFRLTCLSRCILK